MHNWRHLIFYIGLWLALLAPVQAETLPSHVENQPITDISGQLPGQYLAHMEARLRQYPFHVELVYLPGTQGLHLGRYASKLFAHWHMASDSMLVVVALDRRKIGIHAGKDLKGKLKADSQDQELALPTPKPGASPQAATKPLEPEINHLDLVPEAIDTVSQALVSEAKASPASQASAEDVFSSEDGPGILPEHGSGTPALDPADWLWLLWLLLLPALGAAGWFGFKFWRRWSKTQDLVQRFSLQGQVVYQQLEQVYESLEAVMPDFHGYLGETEGKLKLFLKSIHHLQEEYEAIFDAYDEEIRSLSVRETRTDAIDFFRDLEAKLEEGKQLHEQALTVLANLKDVRAANQQLFTQADTRRQAFSHEISEIRKQHPGLKLTKIQQGYQDALNELQRLERQNERDPLGVDKKLQDWRKSLGKMEQETRSLPYLWQQFNEDLKNRINGLRDRLKGGGTSHQNQSLAEIERLHKTLLQAIEQGDLSTLSRFNEIFTRKLQQLEAEV
ncbi:MAG: hypothetical protein ACAI44_18670 [Candidatus Sericytochromatia bacterium]